MTKKRKYTHNPLSSKVLHSYEPISTKTSDDGYELIIDKDTLWLPTCKTQEKQIKDSDLIRHEDYVYAQRMLEHRALRTRIIIAKMESGLEVSIEELRHFEKSVEYKRCEECLVLDLTQDLDLLDFMPVEEVVYKSKEENSDEDSEEWDEE
jgi:hypothetical protein